ncbi:hypothetical protein ACFPQ1_28390 [Rhodocytophaga aerolata]
MKLINRGLIKYGLIIGMILLITKCNYRTSSHRRFSQALDIRIPDDFKVIKDEYQENWQDFAVTYEITLTDESMLKLTKSIRESKFYNPQAFGNDYVSREMLVEHGEDKAVWARSDSGYIFQNDSDRDGYSAKIDTISLIAEFHEFHD